MRLFGVSVAVSPDVAYHVVLRAWLADEVVVARTWRHHRACYRVRIATARRPVPDVFLR